MYFKKLELRNFRNYNYLSIDFHEKVNIIIGDNAQGKTNLIESLYLTSLGKSFRTNTDNDFILFGKNDAKVKATSVKDGFETVVELAYSGGKKSISIDGDKKKKNIDLLENNYIVIFSPEDLKIVKEEPEKRRRFIDREICQLKPVYYKNLARYKKVLLHRNTLLKQNEFDSDSLYIWNQEMIDYGSRLMLARKEFVDRLSVISNQIHKSITENKENLEISYDSNIEMGHDIISQKEIFLKNLSSSYKKDLSHRTSTCGPHRDDIKISINGTDIRSFGSQGQQRTAALSLKLAEIKLIYEETGVKPVLLLDDVLSELDVSRQKFLIKSFSDVQIFLTTTEIQDVLKDSINDCNIYIIEDGTISDIKIIKDFSN